MEGVDNKTLYKNICMLLNPLSVKEGHMPAYEFDYIKKEVKEITQQVGRLSPDNAFIVWFLRAFFTDDQDQAINV